MKLMKLFKRSKDDKVQGLVIKTINSLSGFEYWCYSEDFTKFLDIASMIDTGSAITKRQYDCLINFVEPTKHELKKYFRKVRFRNGKTN